MLGCVCNYTMRSPLSKWNSNANLFISSDFEFCRFLKRGCGGSTNPCLGKSQNPSLGQTPLILLFHSHLYLSCCRPARRKLILGCLLCKYNLRFIEKKLRKISAHVCLTSSVPISILTFQTFLNPLIAFDWWSSVQHRRVTTSSFNTNISFHSINCIYFYT